MKVKEKSNDTGIFYQFEDTFEGYDGTVIVDIAYSGEEDGDGNDILEFEWAAVIDEANPELTLDQISAFNEEIENGREEEYVQILVEAYKGTDIRFDVGEYKHNPLSTLYDKNAITY